MSKPAVSVIVPVYNAARYIDTCLHSLLNQSYQDFEILICDDQSQDESWAKLETYQDPRIKIFKNEENEGVVFTRNRLLDQARGDFLTFQDADDYAHPDRLSRQVTWLNEHPDTDACGTQFIKVDNEGNELFKSGIPTDQSSIREALPEAFHFCCASVMVRRSIYDEIGGYHPYFARVNDEDLYWIAFFTVKFSLVNLEDHLYFYRYNPQSLTKNVINIDPKRKYINHITRYLIQQLIDSGTNDLLDGNFEKLHELEKELEKKYLNDPSLIYREFSDHYMHWKDPTNAMKSALMGFRSRPSVANLKYVVYAFYRKHIQKM